MNSLHLLFLKHPIGATLASWFLFSSIVSGMPDPAPTSSIAYVWAHKSLNLLAGNILRSGMLRGVGVQDDGPQPTGPAGKPRP